MELGDTSEEEASPPQPKKREMSKNQRIQMVSMPQTLQMENGMRRGAFTIVAECFSVACSMVHCLWNRVVHMHTSGHIISPEFHSHKKNSRRWRIRQSSSRRESRTSHYGSDGLKESLGVSKTMVHHWIVDSTIRVHSNSLKPVLTEENKVAQLIMALDSHDPQDPTKFLDMMDHIHVDEKWFFLSRQKERSPSA